MKRVIKKIILDPKAGVQQKYIPINSSILKVTEEHGKGVIWLLCDSVKVERRRQVKFILAEADQEFDWVFNSDYIDCFTRPANNKTFHIFKKDFR